MVWDDSHTLLKLSRADDRERTHGTERSQAAGGRCKQADRDLQASRFRPRTAAGSRDATAIPQAQAANKVSLRLLALAVARVGRQKQRPRTRRMVIGLHRGCREAAAST